MSDRVGQDHDGGGRLARGADGLKIHGAQGLSGLDGVADLDAQVEGGALELDGVDTEVQQDLQARLALEADGVTGACDHGDGGVHRGDDRAVVGGLDPEPVSHGLGGEDGVGDVGEVDDRPRHRGGDGDHGAVIWFGHGGFLSRARRSAVSGRAARLLSGAGRGQRQGSGQGGSGEQGDGFVGPQAKRPLLKAVGGGQLTGAA